MMNFVIVLCLLLYSCSTFPAALNGQLYIKNDHPTFQFECKYKVGSEELGPITIYKDMINLGFVYDITDVQVKRYGKWFGLGADYYSFPAQLAQCKRSPDQNCVLRIVPSLTGWTVEARIGEQLRRKELVDPIDYFEKAESYEITAHGNVVEPRHILDLGADYSEVQVTERQKILSQQIAQRDLSATMGEQVLSILQNAAYYAKKMLPVSKNTHEYQKLLLEFRGKLHPERVARGRQLACNIFKGTIHPITNQEAYIGAIINLMWFYYDIAIQKNQAFEEGTFIIQDNDDRLYDFLMKYVKMVNPSITGTLTDPALMVSTDNQYAYSRGSTHFMNAQNRYRHYGIDIRFSGETFERPFLPVQKAHLLFGKIGQGLIFIKMENFGLTPQSIAMHGKELGESKLRKLVPGLHSFLQAYVPKYVDDLTLYYIGTDDDPNYRKEHIPQEILQHSLEIVKKAPLSDEQFQTLVMTFSRYGIRGIYNAIYSEKSPLPQAQKNELETYLTELRRTGLDHQNIRYGREVIITDNELEQMCS